MLRSRWKLVVCLASCVCVIDPRACVFNRFISSAKVFISSSNKFVSRAKCLSPAQNAFVTSDKHVRLQCDLYVEVSSKDYLVVSDKRVHLQCEIMLGGE